MKKNIVAIVLIFSTLFELQICAPFTAGNLIVTYAVGAQSTNRDQVLPGSIAEITTNGTLVQTMDIPQAEIAFIDNLYMNGPNLAVKKDFASFVGGYYNGMRKYLLLAANGTYEIHTGDYGDLRNFYHDGGLYTVGTEVQLRYTRGYTVAQLTSGLSPTYDVFIYDDQLYVVNWFNNNFLLAKVGDGVPINGSNSVTTVVPATAFGLTYQFTFHKKNNEDVLYAGTEQPNELRKLVFENEAWVTKYKLSFSASDFPLCQVVFENGNGTTTVLIALYPNGIYETIDDGTAFSTPTLLFSVPGALVKGISFAPTTCYNGVMDGDETATDCGGEYCPAECPPQAPVSTPVDDPVSEPVTEPVSSTPIDTPASEPVADTPIDAPLAAPTAVPTASPVSAPQSDNTPAVSSGLVSVQISACTVLAISTLTLLI